MFSRIPFAVKLAVLLAAVVAAFFVVVTPLFASSKELHAEIDGRLPASVAGTHQTNIDLDIDNTGEGAIDPICIRLDSTPAGVAKSVTFQGLETLPFHGNLVCGGELTAQESISIVIDFDLSKTTSLSLRVTPQRNDSPVGTTLSGVVLITH